ncbi:Alpha/beta hydrolase family protein [Nocardia amikacinitolerans]|uniref:Alpha/beta hydrolase family protein n=1 Tax=Nocardia amikacinitolerans TaxID=756689 RepID=A0A285LRN3_9NOCA|nr:alpha/beta fold hydrolase [Nocardia amikacinitolerans]SNY87588.1 Alpha/beta hydrolase family protein [Nocardia amikacinitolerans]
MSRLKSIRALWNSTSVPDPVDVLIMGGTWNPNGDGVTAAFAAGLDLDHFRPRVVPYPADYGRSVPYADSVEAGRKALITAMKSSPHPVVLAGYSQGAAIAGDVAASVGGSARVVACALIADPLRPAGECIGADPGGYGIAGQRQVPNVPVYWTAAPGDPITALPEGNPLRSIADLSAYFSLSSPHAAMRWGRSLIDVAAQRQLQRWWSPQHWRSWSGAVAFARGYLVDGRHTEDYIRGGHARELAERLNAEVVEGALRRRG